MSASHQVTGEKPSLLRRGLWRARRVVARRGLVAVRQIGADRFDVIHLARRRHWYRLDDPSTSGPTVSGTLRIVVSDPASLVRLAAAGLLRGTVHRVVVRIRIAPTWLSTGGRPPAVGRDTTSFAWRRAGAGLRVDLRWSRGRDVVRALDDVVCSVLRARPWPQASGPMPALDRQSWLDGGSTWPQGRLAAGPPPDERDDLGRPLGPFQAVTSRPAGTLPPPVVTAVANPFGRTLFGAATRYRLVGEQLVDDHGRVVADFGSGVEAGLLRSTMDKYAVVTVDRVPNDRAHLLRTLAACGVVFAAADPGGRKALGELGLVAVADPAEVDDLRGYALSVAAARQVAITADAALRSTTLNGGPLSVPSVSVVLSSMRADHIEGCLAQLAAQTYPALEAVIGLHGYDVPAETIARWQRLAPYPVRTLSFDADLPFGVVLGELTQAADGVLVTKVDDDDSYGRHHVTDLVIARHTSGADVVAKGARFVHLPDRRETVDRAWAAPEIFNVTPAGGTMLFSRGALERLGGWSTSSKHVDTDLLRRLEREGGVVYRTHALEYAYWRRTDGHTFQTDMQRILDEGQRRYDGLPDAILDPDIEPSPEGRAPAFR